MKKIYKAFFLMLIFAMSYPLVAKAQNEILFDFQVGDFSFRGDGTEMDFASDKAVYTPFTKSVTDVKNTGVGLYMVCATNHVVRGDFGFVQDETNNFSRFLITGYTTSKKYIDWIEIDWSTEERSGGKLHVYGSSTAHSIGSTLEDIKTDPNIIEDAVLGPQEGVENPISVYNFKKGVNYIAIVFEPGKYYGADPAIARFSSFKIHFTDTAPVEPEEPNGPEKVELRFGAGQTQIDDYYWRNNQDITLDGFVTFPTKENSQPYTAEELGLQFYLVPEFTPTPKPSVDAMPENWTFHQKLLYRMLEKDSENVYDGYLETVSPILCDYDDTNKRLTLKAPCSGLYKLIALTDNEYFTVSHNELHFNIWPNIYNTYEWLVEQANANPDIEYPVKEDAAYYFYLNAVGFSGKGEHDVMLYPYDLVNTDEPHQKTAGRIHVPGLYDAKIYYRWANEQMETSPNVRPMPVTPYAAIPEGYKDADAEPINLSNLGTGIEKLNLRISKNGALTPLMAGGNSVTEFGIQLSHDVTFDTALAVERIEGEGAKCVEYYNLNGVKMSGSRLMPGLYIRREGGKTAKVLVR